MFTSGKSDVLDELEKITRERDAALARIAELESESDKLNMRIANRDAQLDASRDLLRKLKNDIECPGASDFQRSVCEVLISLSARSVGHGMGVGARQILRWARGESVPPEPARRTFLRMYSQTGEDK